MTEKIVIISKEELDKLPKTSGVYFFYSKKVPVYIGKANNIKSRVKNHFQQPSYCDNLFINIIDKIGFINTNSEIEALILEANLIKKHQPKYNVIWKDDKNYFYVAIKQTNNKNLKYVFITHQKTDQKTIYIGPFVEGTALKKTLRFLRKVFPYYSVKNHPKSKCTYCHLDLCLGPNPDISEHKKNIKELILVLKGNKSNVLRSLKKEMQALSKEKKFEEASKVRDRIYALQQIMSHTQIIKAQNPKTRAETWPNTEKNLKTVLNIKNKISKIECYDVSNIQGKQATGAMVVFVNGAPNKNLYRKFKIKLTSTPNDIAMLKEVFQRRFKHKEWKYPNAILIDGGKAQLNAAIEIKNQFTNTEKIKVMSIAKGRQELFIEGQNQAIALRNLPQEIYNLIINLDDQAHSLAITYHKKLRRKALLK